MWNLDREGIIVHGNDVYTRWESWVVSEYADTWVDHTDSGMYIVM